MYEPFHIPPQMQLPAELSLALFEAAAAAARATARAGRGLLPPPRRRPVGETLRPGPGTPLWNELRRQAIPFLRRRGQKVGLARILGLPRQRVHDCLKVNAACFDAERTLMLLCWVARRQQGRDLLN